MKTLRHMPPTLAVVASILTAARANAADTDPLDFVAPPPDSNVVLLYAGRWFSNTQYANSNPVSSTNIHSEYGVLAAVHFFEVSGVLFGVKAVVPASHVDSTTPAGASASGSGVGDPKLVLPVWLLRRPESRTYLGVIGYFQFPVGAYSRDGISPGTNRFNFTFQPGFTTALIGNLSLDLVADIQVFANNNDIVGGGSSEKKPFFSLQAHLTYDLGHGFSASAGAYEYLGGKTKTRGVSDDNSTETTTAIVGLNNWVTPNAGLQFQYRSDVFAKNGPRFDGLQFRFVSVF